MADDCAELADGAEAKSHNRAKPARYDATGLVRSLDLRTRFCRQSDRTPSLCIRLNCELLGTIALVALESA